MSVEAIKTIKACEQSAAEMQKEAVREAAKRLMAANTEAARLTEESEEKTNSEIKEILKMSEQSAEKVSTQITDRTKQECQVMKAEAESKMDEAVNLIIERVVNAK